MNYGRLALAVLGAFVAYMALGSVLFVALPSLKVEFQKYPAVYRDHDGQMSHMPFAMGEILVSIVVVSVLYAWVYRQGYGLMQGTELGLFLGLFAVCVSVLHDFAILNIGLRLTVLSAITFLLQWVIVGLVIGAIYRPAFAVAAGLAP